MRSYTTKLTVAALAAATAFSLAACGPDNPDGPAATGGSGGGSTGAAPAPTTAAPGAAGGAAGGSTAAPSGGATGGATAGGAGTAGAAGGGAGGGKLPQPATSVKFGQPATVDFADKTSKVATKLEISVTGVEPGSIKDFQDAKASTAGLEGRALFYVNWTMKNVGDGKLSFTAPDSKFQVFDAGGRTSMFANTTSANPIAKCQAPNFATATKGTEIKGCDIISFEAGGTPVLVGYSDPNDITKLQAAWTK